MAFWPEPITTKLIHLPNVYQNPQLPLDSFSPFFIIDELVTEDVRAVTISMNTDKQILSKTSRNCL